MLIRQGDARTLGADTRLACALAAVAGALNAAAFQAVGFFAANMTGNVSSLSDKLALGQWAMVALFLLIVLAFVGGGVISTLLVNVGRRHEVSSIYALSVLLEGAGLVVLGCADLWLFPAERNAVLVLGLSFLMGLQNAVVTRISGARVRTTHVSGTATDIGIEVGMLIDIARGREPRDQAGIYWQRLALHAPTVLSFLVGGVAGVWIYAHIGGYLLFVAAFALCCLAAPAVLRSQRWVTRP